VSGFGLDAVDHLTGSIRPEPVLGLSQEQTVAASPDIRQVAALCKCEFHDVFKYKRASFVSHSTLSACTAQTSRM
jgi:hypothetical protein